MATLIDEQKDEIRRQYVLINNNLLKSRETEIKEDSSRDVFQRDYARILYSPSFRRLQGKMQINGIKSDAFYRNRLTHSLEVGQIALSIAYNLSSSCSNEECRMYKDDIFVLEAAALAHDIGHPAFGHKGERVLDEIAKKFNLRFEGNAQNYKILRSLEHKDPHSKGLNLTKRTLLAINKYIVKEDAKVKKFMYKSDFDYLSEVRNDNRLKIGNHRTLDVQIIELADDIAYAVHDLEDGLQLRKFNIDEIIHILRKKDPNDKHKLYEDFITIVNQAKDFPKSEKEKKESSDSSNFNVQTFSKLFRMRLTSILVDTFVNDITIGEVDEKFQKEHGVKKGTKELMLNKYKHLLKELKDAVFECSTRDTNIQEYERKGEIIIKSLFNFYTDLSKNNDAKLLPPDYRPVELDKEKSEQNKDTVKSQLIQNTIDYIAGMMDTFAISEYEHLFNKKFDEIDLSQNIEVKTPVCGIKKIVKKLFA